MVGPRITLRFSDSRFSLGIVDLILATLVISGVLHERLDPRPSLAVIVPIGVLLLALALSVNLVSERLRLRISKTGPAALDTLVSLPCAVAPTLTESRSVGRAARSGLAGMGIDLAIGLGAVGVFLLLEGTSRPIGDLGIVAAVAVGGSAAIRFLTAPSCNAGRIVRWMMEFTFDDDETALRITRTIGYLTALLLFCFGVVLVTSEGEAGFWGIGLAAAGIDVGVLASLVTRQSLWLRTADDRVLGDLLEVPHAVVSATSPVDEMVSVLSVDGPHAIAVVRDAAGRSVGIMRFQQLRTALGQRGHTVTIGEVMVPIDKLPEVAEQTTVLAAAQLLIASGRPALRYRNQHGKTVIVTARDLGVPD